MSGGSGQIIVTGGGAAFSGAKIFANTAGAIPGNLTPTQVAPMDHSYDGYDEGGYTTPNANALTIPAAGYYNVQIRVQVNAVNPATLMAGVQVNAGYELQIATCQDQSDSSGDATLYALVTGSEPAHFAAGDVLTLWTELSFIFNNRSPRDTSFLAVTLISLD